MTQFSFFSPMDRLFDEWASPTPWQAEEAEGHYLLTLDMPGVKRDDIQLELLREQLAIRWARRGSKFQRSFTLPSGVEADKIEADYQDGVLRVMIPKAEAEKPRQIKVTSGRNLLERIAS